MKPYPVHPAAEIFPLLAGPELRALADDIRVNGLRQKLILYRGQLLDGRNRLAACKIAKVDPLYVGAADDIDPLAYVVSVNLRRRHLDESQRAMAAARCKVLFEEAARGRQHKGARADPHEAGKASTKAAELLNVSPRGVESATKVQRGGAPELVEAVDSGKVAVSTAADLAELPRARQREIVASADPRVILDAAKGIRAERTKARRAERTDKLAGIARGNGPLLTETHYPVIYADPPWKYDAGTTDPSREIANQYPPMELDAIKAMEVGKLATPAAVLFLWAVNPLLPEALEVMRAWGFEYRSNWAWDKEIAGMGVWGFGQHELLLIGVRGDMPTAPENTRPPSVIRARRGEHSAKPAEAAERIERMFPTLPKIELFCRTPRPGWSAWGNQSGGRLGVG
jgi:N6-adenosine-specific RNA methylase IME4